MEKPILTQRCVYYNGRGKCAFWGQSKCVHKRGLVPIEEHGKLVERLEKKFEELAKENYKLKEGDDEW